MVSIDISLWWNNCATKDNKGANIDYSNINDSSKIEEEKEIKEEKEETKTTDALQDALEIETIVTNFSNAYFAGNIEEISKFLVDPYEWDIEVYADKDSDIIVLEITGLPEGIEYSDGEICTVYLKYKVTEHADMVESLTIELIKENGWKICFYGLEG